MNRVILLWQARNTRALYTPIPPPTALHSLGEDLTFIFISGMELGEYYLRRNILDSETFNEILKRSPQKDFQVIAGVKGTLIENFPIILR